MQVRKRKDRLPRSRHQPRTNPHRPRQSRRLETMATKTNDPQTSTIHPGNPRIPKTLHPRIRPHRPTTHQPPKKGSERDRWDTTPRPLTLPNETTTSMTENS